MKRLLSLASFAGLTAFAIPAVVQFVQHGTADWQQSLLVISITYLVGVNVFIVGSGHLKFPDPIAESIGRQKGSPFQWEMVAEKNLSPGNAGFIFYYDVIVPIYLSCLYILYSVA